MTNIHHQPDTRRPRKVLPGTAIATPPVLSPADQRPLELHLQSGNMSREPLPARLPRYRLDAPRRSDGEAPRDMVAGGCVLGYRIGDGPVQTGRLCCRSRTGAPGGDVIPAFSLLGLPVTGTRVARSRPLPREDSSVSTVPVLHVAHPV